MPDHFPVRREVIEPEEDTTGMVKIGEEITRQVNYTPGTMEIIETVRPKYARPEAEQTEGKPAIVIAPVVDQVLPKSIAGVGLLVQITVAKYIDHLPLYRQRQMIKRDFAWDIPSSTLGDWFAATCTLLEPLYDALQKQVLDTDYLQGDESRLTVLEYGKEKTKNKSHRHPPKARRKSHLGYMWVFRNPVTGAVVFAYRPGRGANVLHETLKDFSGKLQSDGYSSYTSFLKKHKLDVELVSCLAHIRRKFFDARKNHPELAELALKSIQYLYDLGRKNYLFAGSHKAGQRAAMMYSFFATCKEHDVNPRVWLRDVLLRIRDTRPSRMGKLLPGRWKENQVEGV